MMWWNRILYTFVSTCLTTSSLRIVPPLPPTVAANRNHIVTWIRTHDDIDDVPPDIDLPEAIPINGGLTQSFVDDNDDVIGSKKATSADIRSDDLDGGGETNDFNDEDENPMNGSVTVNLNIPIATPFRIVAVKRQTLEQEVLTSVTSNESTLVVNAGPSPGAGGPVRSTSVMTSNTTHSTSSSTVSSTVNEPAQIGTPLKFTKANSNTNPTLPPAPTSSLMNPSTARATPNTGAIAGGVVGGVFVILVVATVVFYILKRRKIKPKHNLDPTPYLGSTPLSGSDVPYMDIRERKMQMLGQRESLERELEVYEQASQESNSRAGDVSDGPINGGYQEGDIVQVLRRMEVLTQRIATLEAGMAPPDYSSRTS